MPADGRWDLIRGLNAELKWYTIISNTLDFLCTWRKNTFCSTGHIEDSPKYNT